MRRLRAGLCLALSLLTAAPPSSGAELSLGAPEGAPTVRLEPLRLEVPTSLQAAALPVAQAPLSSLVDVALTLPTARISATPLEANASASAAASAASISQLSPAIVENPNQAVAHEALASAESITAAAASAQHAGETAQTAGLDRAWSGRREQKSETVDSLWPATAGIRSRANRLLRRVTTGAAVALPLLAPAVAFAAPAAPALPAAHAVPVGVSAFLAHYGHWVGAGAVVLGTLAAIRVSRYLIDKFAANANPTARASLRLAATVGLGVAGVLVALHTVGVPAAALTPSALFGSLGVSMILKDEIGNPIEAAKLTMFQRFRVGDKVQIGSTGEKGTVESMDLQYVSIRPDAAKADEPWRSDWNYEQIEVAASSVKVFGPYSTSQKVEIKQNAPSLLRLASRLASVPALMWRATREMKLPDLKRAALWMAAGAGLLVIVPRVKSAVLAFLPQHLIGFSVGLGWASALAAGGAVAYAAWRLGRGLKAAIDGYAAKRGWSPAARKAADAAALGLVAAAAVAALVVGFPLVKVVVTTGLATNLASVLQTAATIFSYAQAAAILALSRAIHNWLKGLLDHIAAKSGMSPHKKQLISLVLDIVALLTSSSLALRAIGMSGGGVAKTLAIGSSVLTMPGTDVLKSLVAGLRLLARRKVKVGDWVKVDGYVGQVLDITVWDVVLSEDGGATHVSIPHAVMKKSFLSLSTPEDVERAKKAKLDAADQAAFVADLYKKSKAK